MSKETSKSKFHSINDINRAWQTRLFSRSVEEIFVSSLIKDVTTELVTFKILSMFNTEPVTESSGFPIAVAIPAAVDFAACSTYLALN